MASTITSSATTKLYFSPTLPATFDNAGYTAVTGWILIGEIESLGTYGGKTAVIKHTAIDTGVVSKRGGSQDFGTMSITAARKKATETDVAALIAAFKNRTPGSFKIVLPALLGDTDYCTGICTGLQTNVGNADQMLQSNIEIEIDSPVITVSA